MNSSMVMSGRFFRKTICLIMGSTSAGSIAPTSVDLIESQMSQPAPDSTEKTLNRRQFIISGASRCCAGRPYGINVDRPLHGSDWPCGLLPSKTTRRTLCPRQDRRLPGEASSESVPGYGYVVFCEVLWSCAVNSRGHIPEQCQRLRTDHMATVVSRRMLWIEPDIEQPGQLI